MADDKAPCVLQMEKMPSILAWASVASKKESEGPLAPYFDLINADSTFGQRTWEKAESYLQRACVSKLLEKAGLAPEGVDCLFAGDLLNQCIGSSYGLRDLSVPFFGLYGACSTMAESLMLASVFVDSGKARHCVAATSSHFCSAERQFRFPLEYGGQRTPTSQWTVTGAGAVLVGAHDGPPYVRAACPGIITDLGIRDQGNMGAAMAPAAARTIEGYLQATGTTVEDYDLILTGDLGEVGSSLLDELLTRDGITLGKRHTDAGLLIYDRRRQPEVCAGGSGCGCSASVLCSYILPRVRQGAIGEMLFVATGALMNALTVQQGESIPGIAHLVHISSGERQVHRER